MVAVARFLETSAGWATLQALAVLAGWLYLTGRRFGKPVPEKPARRRSELEFVEALAEAYRRAGGARLALGALRRRFVHRLSDAVGLAFAAERPTSEVRKALAGWHPERGRRAADLLDESADVLLGSATSDRSLVHIAREFAEFEEELAGGRQHVGRGRVAHPG
jgi:hypothetical protein